LSEENEKNETLEDVHHEIKEKPKKEEKSYILCHIRKIDQNYKLSKKRKATNNTEDLYDESHPKTKDNHAKKAHRNNHSSKEEQIPSFTKHIPIGIKNDDKINLQPLMNYYMEKVYTHGNPRINMLNNVGLNILTKEGQTLNIMNKKSEGVMGMPSLPREMKGNRQSSNMNGMSRTSSNTGNDAKATNVDLSRTKSNTVNSSQFHLDELLNQELKRYDNDNYDYFKIFNVLVHHKYK